MHGGLLYECASVMSSEQLLYQRQDSTLIRGDDSSIGGVVFGPVVQTGYFQWVIGNRLLL